MHAIKSFLRWQLKAKNAMDYVIVRIALCTHKKNVTWKATKPSGKTPSISYFNSKPYEIDTFQSLFPLSRSPKCCKYEFGCFFSSTLWRAWFLCDFFMTCVCVLFIFTSTICFNSISVCQCFCVLFPSLSLSYHISLHFCLLFNTWIVRVCRLFPFLLCVWKMCKTNVVPMVHNYPACIRFWLITCESYMIQRILDYTRRDISSQAATKKLNT